MINNRLITKNRSTSKSQATFQVTSQLTTTVFFFQRTRVTFPISNPPFMLVEKCLNNNKSVDRPSQTSSLIGMV